LPYFSAVKFSDLEVGDRVVCIVASVLCPILDMSYLKDAQAWDVAVLQAHRRDPSRVFLHWGDGKRSFNYFEGLVFKSPYVLSNGQNRTNDLIAINRCRLDDFLPNPPIRQLMLRWIKEAAHALQFQYELDIYLERLNGGCGKDERKIILQKIITAHSPNSLLGEVLQEGRLKLVCFVLEKFCVDKKVLNGIRIGSNFSHPTEVLIQNRRTRILAYLVKKHGLQISGKIMSFCGKWSRHFSAVLSALEIRNPMILRFLLIAIPIQTLGSIFAFPDELGRTPLSLAVIEDKPELVKMLLKVRAPVNQCGWRGDTALAIGMQMGISDSVLIILLEARANVDTTDSTGVAPRDRQIFRRLTGVCSG